jgi:hypothetical protein
LRWSATVIPKISAASSTIMKIPSRLNGARSLKSMNWTMRPRSRPVSASSPKAQANQRRTLNGMARIVAAAAVETALRFEPSGFACGAHHRHADLIERYECA